MPLPYVGSVSDRLDGFGIGCLVWEVGIGCTGLVGLCCARLMVWWEGIKGILYTVIRYNIHIYSAVLSVDGRSVGLTDRNDSAMKWYTHISAVPWGAEDGTRHVENLCAHHTTLAWGCNATRHSDNEARSVWQHPVNNDSDFFCFWFEYKKLVNFLFIHSCFYGLGAVQSRQDLNSNYIWHQFRFSQINILILCSFWKALRFLAIKIFFNALIYNKSKAELTFFFS